MENRHCLYMKETKLQSLVLNSAKSKYWGASKRTVPFVASWPKTWWNFIPFIESILHYLIVNQNRLTLPLSSFDRRLGDRLCNHANRKVYNFEINEKCMNCTPKLTNQPTDQSSNQPTDGQEMALDMHSTCSRSRIMNHS